jgi:hypothetical protein
MRPIKYTKPIVISAKGASMYHASTKIERFQLGEGENVLTKYAAVFAVICLLAAIPTMHVAQDAQTVLKNTLQAMGAQNVKTLQFSATGSKAGVGQIGQNRNPNVAWPVSRVKSYTQSLDLGGVQCPGGPRRRTHRPDGKRVRVAALAVERPVQFLDYSFWFYQGRDGE